jgi:DNA polymerase-3 subunit delta'
VPTFSGIVGHRRLTALLSQAIQRDTLPPTLLFSGPAGIGKFVVAKAVASAVNCLDPRLDGELPVDACGTCRSCDRIARDVHVDVLMLQPDEKATSSNARRSGPLKGDAVWSSSAMLTRSKSPRRIRC